jgi:muconolactone delta-isomerase
MEYLVTMTTHVPDGTSEEEVGEVRAREAGHSSELAAQGHLLRLWRPPLKPCEWRTLGLFAAGDNAELEEVLASMPLRVWRTDEVTPLSPHPNDQAPTSAEGNGGGEFLVTFTRTVADGTPSETLDAATVREAVRAKELAEEGHLVRVWEIPGHALGLLRGRDAEEVQAILDSLPLSPWLTTEITPLSPHPSDPAPIKS